MRAWRLPATRSHVDGFVNGYVVWTADILLLRHGDSGSRSGDLLQHPVTTEELLGSEQVMSGAANAQVVARRRPAATRWDGEVIELHSPALGTAISFWTDERALVPVAGHHLAANRTWDVRGRWALPLSRRVAFVPALCAGLVAL